MKTLERNRQPIFYATQTGKTEIIDADGYKTGQYELTFSNIIAQKQNISAAKGSADVDIFGQNTNYSKTAVTSVLDLNINETSRAWVGFGNVYPYDSAEDYYIGDKCYHGSSLYTCIANTTGTWNPSAWGVISHNYVVVGVAKSLNSVTYALREVKING